MKAQKYKNSVNEIRDHIIYDIINFLNINNIREIDFKNPWIYNMSSITSDTEVIGRLSSNGKVYIDTGLSKFDYNIDLSKLDIFMLIGILEKLEDEDYEIFEYED